jgi:8-oxo-dGTP diphosphatase
VNFGATLMGADVRVGVGVLVVRQGKILLGKRKGSHGAGEWALPGGHLEFGESVVDCARREVLEETGLTIDRPKPGPFSSDLFPEIGRHYVTLFVIADSPDGEPELREPEKCEGWEWFRWSELPTPLFAPLRSLHQQGFDADRLLR